MVKYSYQARRRSIMKKDTNKRTIIIAALIGAVVGAILGMMAFNNNWLG